MWTEKKNQLDCGTFFFPFFNFKGKSSGRGFHKISYLAELNDKYPPTKRVPLEPNWEIP